MIPMSNGTIKGLIAGLLAIMLGCSGNSDEETPAPTVLPDAILALQGSWIDASTNGCTVICRVRVEGTSIGIRYQESADSPVVRETAVFEYVDEEKEYLCFADRMGGWEYRFSRAAGDECFELKIYSSSLEGGSRKMILVRPENGQ